MNERTYIRIIPSDQLLFGPNSWLFTSRGIPTFTGAPGS